MTLLLLASPISSSSNAFANDCISNEDALWLCKGDTSWADGYLVVDERLRELLDAEGLVETLKEERDAFRGLVKAYKGQRDEYKALRDSLQNLLDHSLSLQESYRGQRESTEAELVIVEGKYLNSARHAAQLEAELADAWSAWEVGLFAAGIGAMAVLSGVGVTVLYYQLNP